MSEQARLIFLADTILVVHFLFVAFVVLGLVAIYLGYFLDWRWVRNRLFRIVHLAAIAVVVLQVLLGILCPLTVWEAALRESAGTGSYSGSFIQYWLQRLLYYNAPDWVFAVLYSVFGSIVVVSWFVIKPGRRKTGSQQ